MYVIPKSISSKATCEPSAPTCSSVRNWLLFWASLRLAVSVLWTGVILSESYKTFDYFVHQQRQVMYDAEAPIILTFAVAAAAMQLVELAMIVLFIIAGIKKSARLYLVYYRYCILSLIIYILAVTLSFTLNYNDGPYYEEVYLTYHINDLPILDDSILAFGFVAFSDICLEVFLIYLIKKMTIKYSKVEDVTCEKV